MNTDGFLQANANPEFIHAEFTEVLRSLMRAMAANDGGASNVYRAVEKMEFVMQLIERCEDKISWRGLFTEAVKNLQPPQGEGRERDVINAAQVGMSFLAECTCHDNAARGRASKRLHEFLTIARFAIEG